MQIIAEIIRRFLLNVEVDVFQIFLYIKAWTAFSDPWEVTMADDFGFWIVEAETLQKFCKHSN